MSKRIDPTAAVTRTLGVRLPPSIEALLDEEVALVNASAPGAQASPASVARALLTDVLRARAEARRRAEAPESPTEAPAPTPAPVAPPAAAKAPSEAPASEPTPDPLRERFLSLLASGALTYAVAAQLCVCSAMPLRAWAAGRVTDGRRVYKPLGEQYRERLVAAVERAEARQRPLPPAPAPLRERLLAVLRARTTPRTGLVDVAGAVGALRAEGVAAAALRAELLGLDAAGTLELRPWSGGGGEIPPEAREACPQALDGTVLAVGAWRTRS